MMKILGYGEDALTLWSLTKRLPRILGAFEDGSEPNECIAFFRPSFGRRGGQGSSQFGEFDLILVTKERVILVESKWDRSSEVRRGAKLDLRPEQIQRHEVMRRYILEWTSEDYRDWDAFVESAEADWTVEKPMAPSGSRLSENLTYLLHTIQNKLGSSPKIENAIVLFHQGIDSADFPAEVPAGFQFVAIDYSADLSGNFVAIELAAFTGGLGQQRAVTGPDDGAK
jgi:hypothetical protein